MIGDHRFDQSPLFADDKDRARFIDQLSERVGRHQIRLYLYVLMTNHFHLVFETPAGNCSTFMQALSTAYTVYYNRRHHRHGHLLDGRYKAKLVEGDRYLLALSRYVHLNPVQTQSERAKPNRERISTLRAYRWSSFPSYIGKRRAHEFVDYCPILAMAGGSADEQPKRYRSFVESGLANDDIEFQELLKLSPRSIGGESFRTWIDHLHGKRSKDCNREDVSFRHITEPLPSNTVLETVANALGVETTSFMVRRRNSPLRAIAASMLIRFAGISQRGAAVFLGMGTGGAVSAQLRKLPVWLAANAQLRKACGNIEKSLEELRSSNSRPIK
ncbi:hypothetical protein PDESU_04201 [Pontiella desulfatans]|uniref:Transposase IS200-like domain-containing protein n=1 Tax=Pontiella desulfatans TaxID=2750659 RepID=A0A6C2U882_PONDE|nr:transposase [Pontiella desulfatans]VGO15616.1 hypothetical protein PDESU_04201 [Pontiella desulfatans]